MTTPTNSGKSSRTLLLLHCEGGGIPYLSPFLWQDFLKNQKQDDNGDLPLMLGLELSDTFVSPVYADKNRHKHKSNKKRCRGDDDNVINSSKKGLVGYSFKGKPLGEHLSVYRKRGEDTMNLPIMIVPAFDLVSKAAVCIKSQVISSAKEVSIPTSNGHVRVSPETYYSDTVLPSFYSENINIPSNSKFIPNCKNYVTLYDDVVLTEFDAAVLSSVENDEQSTDKEKIMKRIRKKQKLSVERTINWSAKTDFYNSAGLEKNNNVVLRWGSIVGGTDKELRKICVNEVIANNTDELTGIAFVGLHRLFEKSRESYQNVLRDSLKAIPSKIKTCVLSASSIEEIFDAAKLGVDVIGCCLPAIWARSSRAVLVNFLDSFVPDSASLLELGDTKYAKDKLPLSSSCPCQTCKRHSRSYIHHLIRSKELLAEILLFYHNLYQLVELFRSFNSEK